MRRRNDCQHLEVSFWSKAEHVQLTSSCDLIMTKPTSNDQRFEKERVRYELVGVTHSEIIWDIVIFRKCGRMAIAWVYRTSTSLIKQSPAHSRGF